MGLTGGSQVIERMYRYGNKQDATIKLLWNLFHLQRDDVTFDITTLEKNPAKYFTPRTIGKIINIIDKYKGKSRLTEEDRTELSETLTKVIKQDIDFEELVAQSRKKVAELHEAGLENSEYKKFIKTRESKKKLNKEIKKLTEKVKEEKIKSKRSEIQKRIDQKKKELRNLASIKKVKKNPEVSKILQKINATNLTNSSLETTILLIIDSLEENLGKEVQLEKEEKGKEGEEAGIKSKYLPFTLQQILLGFLWQRCETRKDLIPFFEQLDKEMTKQVNLEALKEESSEHPPVYTKEDQSKFGAYLSNPTKELIVNHYEELSFLYQSLVVWDQPFPPIVSSISGVTYEDYSFPDCGSTSLRNFINILIFNSEKDKLDIKMLKEESNLILDPKLVEFYEKHTGLAKIGARNIHDEWAKVTSDLDGVLYNKGTNVKPMGICEISSRCTTGKRNGFCGLSNMLQVINNLLFGNSAEFAKLSNEQKLDELVKEISHEGFKLEWYSNQNVDDFELDKDITLTFIINDLHTFTWVFKKGHFLIPPPKLELKDFIPLETVLDKMIETKKKKDIALNLLLRYSDKVNTAKLMKEDWPKSVMRRVFFLFNLRQWGTKIRSS